MQLETTEKEASKQETITCRLNYMLLTNQLVNDEIKEEIKKYLETNDKAEPYKICGLHEKQSWKFIAIQALKRSKKICKYTT